ncbi:LOW QUALITY PROTEIN: ephexin-1-like [Haliotis rubra]|uniref:LOW QUALITY PROTEIN: ephexin-1-like n=1 Tax=Haliotis rubra TaxID=36100 RepID=UPI001EE5FA34|nr:LOW QUALITY PROTEIN: ephexin-1-like [Haliotis rubra]
MKHLVMSWRRCRPFHGAPVRGAVERGKRKNSVRQSRPSYQRTRDCLVPHLLPLPPRSSRVLNQTNIENSPPLPPRNQSTSGPTLDMVIPAPERAPSSHSTGDLRRKGQLSVSKDSYLHGQHLKSASLGDVPASMDHTDGNGEEFPDGYVDYDPSTGRTGKTESVDRRDFAKTSVKKKKGSFFRKTATADDRPASSTSSSGYIYPETDQWSPAGVEGQSLYQDLDDDQVYGRLGKEMKIKTSKFVNEPLYQYYTKENVIRANRKLKMEEAISDDDNVVKRKRKKEGGIYEDVEQMMQDGILTEEEAKSAEDISPSKRSTMLEVLGRTGSLHRALWCEMPEVKDKKVLETMEPQERKLQEAMFEIVTSEASYLKSLNILITVFLIAPEFSADHSDRCVVTKRERQVLFSNIGAIRDASEKFLADLEERWQTNCVMNDICDIIYNHSLKNFYGKRVEYVDAVRRLERNPECQSLPMSSFLLLPMQRITRLPLLVDAICHRLEPGSDRHKSSARALENLHRVVRKCNDGAKKMQQTEQMCILASQLDFKVKEIPLISSSRYIVKQAELTRISTDASSRIPFGKAFRGPSKQNMYLFLFNDMVMITKKKGNSYSVTDYCQRNSLHVEAIDNVEKCRLLPQGVPHGCKNLFLLVMLENFEKKQVEMVLACPSASDRTRWIDAVTPVQTSETERIYEDWDCPQVQCVKKYVAQEPDELSLEESDVVNVYKKTEDQWYEGERIRDGERGWFPACYTEEIMNSHVRSRNLRLRYRLLLASQQYTETVAK